MISPHRSFLSVSTEYSCLLLCTTDKTVRTVIICLTLTTISTTKHLWEEVIEGTVDSQFAIDLWTNLVPMSNILRNQEQETTLLQLIPYMFSRQ